MSANEESSGNAAPGVRQVTEREADRVTELFTLAFYDDPNWSWAFPASDKRMDHHRTGGASTCIALFGTGASG
jgi:hypothetical protein